ncbi:Rne/Rng family ribonuclease [Geminocystis sp. NIES-3709]|uniref:Rne/Rng family ribonuclease n=1 Tax=Geminocystis sp. NIES-3709 TaxID=1617448 RepID=UPI0005FC52AC|nr:Rne/Rng family ribonuclease [Geminocystis sp. NIES-3709]BAQ65219.1 cytoplasmic axial filament protein CafA and Ribonuclease G [Geminocystis sp. NIES-3709]
MPKQIIIAEKHHIAAVFAEDQIQELVVATGNQQVGDIYLGTVENVISGIDAAFVNIGDAEKNGFIHVTDLGPLRLRKTAGAITELLFPQQKVLVQVMKEPTGSKGPRLTGNISLPGRYLVLMPYGKGVSLSRRIKNENERNRLRALAILLKPSGMGLLVRTEAESTSEEGIIEDLDLLKKQWDKIQQESNYINAPALLNRDDDFIQRVLRDMYSDDVNRIVVDSEESVKRVKKQLTNWGAGRHPEGVFINAHQENTLILDYFRVNAAIKEALKPRVDLPSGGYIIIEPTEALTVIDVNSGSFTHSATSRETVLWTNYEAAIEIARQLKLRNIGGVIVVDFIDMDSRRDKLKLLEHFDRVLKTDKARPQIAQLSELGLVELTRKRQGKNIYELFGQPCSHCNGLGLVAHLPGHHEVDPLPSNYYTPIIVNKTPDKPIIEEKIIFSDDYSNDGDDTELLDNGSYQDQVNGAVRRRRRRRETPLKEEPMLLGNNNFTESEIKSDRSSIREPNTNSRDRKGHNVLPRHGNRDEAKLEKVVVEMTETEQEVYALMGVSPILRLGQEFKDPKSVVIYVKSPDDNSNNIDFDKSQDKENYSINNDEVSEYPLLDAIADMVSQNIDEEDETIIYNNSAMYEYSEDKENEMTISLDSDMEEYEEVPSYSIPDIVSQDTDSQFQNLIVEPQTITETLIKEALESDRPVVRTRRRRSSTSSIVMDNE